MNSLPSGNSLPCFPLLTIVARSVHTRANSDGQSVDRNKRPVQFDNAGAMMSVDDTLLCSFQVRLSRLFCQRSHVAERNIIV